MTRQRSLRLDLTYGAQPRRSFTDHRLGRATSRPELEACLEHLRAGDTLLVWRLDRLGRSLRHLIDTVAALQEREIGFRSLTEGLDTTTAAGRMTFHIFGGLAEFEHGLVQERALAGLEAARGRGRHGGRPSSMTPDKLAAAVTMREQKRPMRAIATALGVSRATLYRHLASPTPESI